MTSAAPTTCQDDSVQSDEGEVQGDEGEVQGGEGRCRAATAIWYLPVYLLRSAAGRRTYVGCTTAAWPPPPAGGLREGAGRGWAVRR